jgi:hypothetical protein
MKIHLLESTVDLTEPLIYLWEIKDTPAGEVIYRYVGKAKNGAGRPLSDYKKNVLNLLAGRPYRRRDPIGFRTVHHELAKAVRGGQHISLKFLCNVLPEEDIDEVEKRWQKEYGLCQKESRLQDENTTVAE